MQSSKFTDESMVLKIIIEHIDCAHMHHMLMILLVSNNKRLRIKFSCQILCPIKGSIEERLTQGQKHK